MNYLLVAALMSLILWYVVTVLFGPKKQSRRTIRSILRSFFEYVNAGDEKSLKNLLSGKVRVLSRDKLDTRGAEDYLKAFGASNGRQETLVYQPIVRISGPYARVRFYYVQNRALKTDDENGNVQQKREIGIGRALFFSEKDDWRIVSVDLHTSGLTQLPEKKRIPDLNKTWILILDRIRALKERLGVEYMDRIKTLLASTENKSPASAAVPDAVEHRA